jgi:hypothetical protein
MHVIIDGDPLIYRAGYAAERKVVHAILRNVDGEIDYYKFEPDENGSAYDSLKRHLEDGNKSVVETWSESIPEPVENALQIVKAIIGSVVDAVIFRFGNPEPRVSVLLSGPDNFRERIATIKPYKGNRDPDAKPYHYQAIRDYLSKRWGATVVHGREADDECSILAWAERKRGLPYIIVTLDKDLDQIPGWHIDVRTKTLYNIEPLDADLYFYQQVLSGDPTDNIQGVPGIGPKKARKFVEEWCEAWGTDDPTALWYRIEEEFPCPEHALETARLVYLQREPNELWVPPGEPKQYLEEGLDD